MLVQAYPSAAEVNAGANATFVVWAWTTAAAANSISVQASVDAESYLGAVTFPICPSASGATCKISSLAVGQVYELLASVPVSASAAPGKTVSLTAKTSASGALSYSSGATETVVSTSTAIANPSVASPPLLPFTTLPSTGTSAVNPANLFPTVGSGTGTSALGLPKVSPKAPVHVAEAAATVPLDARLIGAQLAGLAVLAAAVMIAVARLSLRVPKPTVSPSPQEPKSTAAGS